MPQGRIVLKRICQSKKLASLKTDGARLLYTWLITNVDVNGCFSGDPQVIKGQIFTRLKKSYKTIEQYISDLEQNKLIIRYTVNGDIFLNIPDFVEKQPYLNREREGKTNIPPPTQEQLMSNSGVTQAQIEIESKSKIESECKGKSATPATSFTLPPDKERWIDIAFTIRLSEEEASLAYDNFGGNNWKRSNGNAIESWEQVAFVLNYWKNNRGKFDNDSGRQQLRPIPGRICSVKGCKMPAVYIDKSGDYDNPYCSEHMPEKVKDRYR